MPDQPKPMLKAIEGYRFEDIKVGMSATFTKTISGEDINAFVAMVCDTNPLHSDIDFSKKTMFGKPIVPGMLTASFISTILGTKLPGPGAIYMSQTLKFVAPVFAGDTVESRAEVAEINTGKRRIVMKTECWVGDRQVVAGEALIWVPPADEEARLRNN